MYNRYIPDENGGYRRMEVSPESVCAPAAAKPLPAPQEAKKNAAGGFDADDLLILLILLLLLLDGEETDKTSILAALAAFILL